MSADEEREPMTTDEMSGKINDALNEVVREHEDGVVIKWSLALETIGPDGRSGVWFLNSPGIAVWDIFGLLRYAEEKVTGWMYAQ